jgi:hypothetical protein
VPVPLGERMASVYPFDLYVRAQPKKRRKKCNL